MKGGILPAALTAVLLFQAAPALPQPAPSGAASGADRAIRSMAVGPFREMTEKEGRWVLVFTAAWCGPCIAEMPDLNALYGRYRDKGLRMVGVSVDFDGPGALQPIVDRLRVDFPVYWLGEGALEAYGITRIPLVRFIRNGAVVEELTGLRSKAFFEERIKAFLEAP